MATSTALSRPESTLNEHFDNLRRMVRVPSPGQPATIGATLGIVNELYTQLTATRAALNKSATPPQSDVSNKIMAEAGRAAEPVRFMLIALISGGNASTVDLVRHNLSNSLNTGVGDFCKKALAGRYPLDKNSKRDATQDDFASIFALGGLMDDFFEKNLVQYTDTSSRPWKFRKTGDVNIGGSSNTLEEFRRASGIRDVFFMGGSRMPAISLTFAPADIDASILQFNLDVDGQLIKYSDGPQFRAKVQWPGSRGTNQMRLQLSPASANGSFGEVFEGPWALFHLFDKARIIPSAQPEKFVVIFNVGGRNTQFEVVANSIQNPFRLRDLEQLTCPDQL